MIGLPEIGSVHAHAACFHAPSGVRQLMENELLELWGQDKKSILFVTHDLEEAISLSDRVVVLSSGPASRPIAKFAIDIPRPRDVTEIVNTARYIELHKKIWDTLKVEVLASYQRVMNTA